MDYYDSSNQWTQNSNWNKLVNMIVTKKVKLSTNTVNSYKNLLSWLLSAVYTEKKQTKKNRETQQTEKDKANKTPHRTRSLCNSTLI